ncbi:MAG: hypothetical protein WA183_17555 [Chthoniobacterales bacterium]
MAKRKDRLPRDALQNCKSLGEKYLLLLRGPAFYGSGVAWGFSTIFDDKLDAKTRQKFEARMADYFMKVVKLKNVRLMRQLADEFGLAVKYLNEPYRKTAAKAVIYEMIMEAEGKRGSSGGLVKFLKDFGITMDKANARALRRELRGS